MFCAGGRYARLRFIARRGRRCFGRFHLSKFGTVQESARARQTHSQRSRHRLELRVVVDVHIQHVHLVEVRVGEEFLQRRTAQVFIDGLLEERLVVRTQAIERFDRRQRHLGRCGWIARRRRR